MQCRNKLEDSVAIIVATKVATITNSAGNHIARVTCLGISQCKSRPESLTLILPTAARALDNCTDMYMHAPCVYTYMLV